MWEPDCDVHTEVRPDECPICGTGVEWGDALDDFAPDQWEQVVSGWRLDFEWGCTCGEVLAITVTAPAPTIYIEDVRNYAIERA